MSWPTPQDYNEAIQNLHLNFEDSELRSGTLKLTPLGLPAVASGSFASVYQVNSTTKKFAVRCFLKDVPTQQSRYECISSFVMKDALPYTVDFHFLPRGILVRGQWYPVLKMDWVTGVTLDNYVRQHLNDAAKIAKLCANFRAMMFDVEQAGIAHGDLQHGNILITPEEHIRLVDYDGMFVPGLAGSRGTEIGHRNYQHPARSADDFDARVDNFAAWSIYTSLRILSIDPSLATKLGACDECLLFRQDDYTYPLNSHTFAILEEHQNEEIRNHSKILRAMLALPIGQIPFLSEQLTVPQGLPQVHPSAAINVAPSLGSAIQPSIAMSHTGSVRVAPNVVPHAEQALDLDKFPALADYMHAMLTPNRTFIHPEMRTFILARDHGSLYAQGSDHGAVFRFHKRDGEDAIVKVFLKGDRLLRQRYQMLHTYLVTSASAKLRERLVDFTFIAEGVRVLDKYYPCLLMPSMELRNLVEAVEEFRHERSKMAQLTKQFVELMQILQESDVVHGDIEPDNILAANGKLLLIDFDLLTVPLTRPLASPLLGNKHYQHPRLRAGTPAESDNFSAWILYYSMRLLTLDPKLWNIAGAKPGRLLFHIHDLQRPSSSFIFSKLDSHFNEEVRMISQRVQKLCMLAPQQIPVFQPKQEFSHAILGKVLGWWRQNER